MENPDEEIIKDICAKSARELMLILDPEFEIKNPGIDWSQITVKIVDPTTLPVDLDQPDLERLDGVSVWKMEKD